MMNANSIYKACVTITIYGRQKKTLEMFLTLGCFFFLFGKAHISVLWKPLIGCETTECSFRSLLGGQKQSPESILIKSHREMYMWARRVRINVTDILSGQHLGD